MAKGDYRMRKSSVFLSVLLLGGCLFLLIMIFSRFQSRADLPAIERLRAEVDTLRLTDLCLFTEARYTRNPSQADLSSAFQDHPFSLEHFPAGSFGRNAAEAQGHHGPMD